MLGIVRPCRHRLKGGLHRAWAAHLCGLCLTLRDQHGHLSRLVTNYDGLLVSVLTEAQRPDASPHRQAKACVLRGFKGADVVDAHAEGARLAAAVSLMLAAAKLRDHVADGDGPHANRLVAAVSTRLAQGWYGAAEQAAAAVRFDPSPLAQAVERQTALEADPSRTLQELTEPTETAVAAAFAHTAVLTGMPYNKEPLTEIGRHFGRIAHLLDAVDDLREDRRRGAYNPLLATATDFTDARSVCDEAHQGIGTAFAALTLPDPTLARTLLVNEVGRAVNRSFSAAQDEPKEEEKRASKGNCVDRCDCCSCDCCDCGCCGCDCSC